MNRKDAIIVTLFGMIGLLIGTAYIYSGWLRNPKAVFLSIVMSWLLIAFLLGFFRTSHHLSLRRMGWGIAYVVLILGPMLLPLAARRWQLNSIIAEIPLVEPRPPILHFKTDFFRFNSVADFHIYYRSYMPFDDVCRFYEAQIAGRGWKSGPWKSQPPQPDIPNYGRARWCKFERDGVITHLFIWEILGKFGGTSVSIGPLDNTDAAPDDFPQF